ncbi:hypothetical protein [Massilia sp. Leaf139]|uniref:hypothetical protein n=1 Tax=Massilia sp. Leaf139 TaxID=1736272 RepID=UPI0006FE49C7|nr:hypothetical protein [Massilia sp. Leaf139]KQQ96170.1 hypothetical protein ASF77_21955 [Massilia sp. Leaf139]
MSRGARFHYALEPVRLTRTWHLDALLLELGEQNGAIASHALAQADIEARIAQAAAAWEECKSSGRFQSVTEFALATRYMSELARQAREASARMAELAALRDATVERVVLAKRAVEAAEAHREEMHDQFIRQRLSGDFKLADDQWNTLQSGAVAHDS